MSAALLKVSKLTVEGEAPDGGWRNILANVSISVEPGEIVALIGESGAGKTTLALAALGYCRAGTRVAAGEVRFGSTEVLSLSRRAKQDFRGREVAYVAQSAASALNPSIRIGEQVAEGLWLHRLEHRVDPKTRMLDLLSLLQLPDPAALARRYPSQMSGGQQQRVMTAMAMAFAPKLLVLDEPTTALDVTTQIEVLRAIRDAIREHDTAAIYVSHDLSVVAQIATRIIVMRHGDIVEQGSAEDILANPRRDYTRALLAAVRKMDGPNAAAQSAKASQPVLSLSAIAAGYRRTLFRLARESELVLHDVSLDVAPGETLALAGESGSGKSTLVRVIAGLHKPSAGSVRLDGKVLETTSRRRAKTELRRVQIVLQSPEQALNPMIDVGGTIGQVLRFYWDLSETEIKARTAELLDMVGLAPAFAGKRPGELSGGQRQRVAIARAFAARPDVILCDEFLSALDTLVAARIIELMAKLKREHNVAYVFVSHDLATVAQIADRVAVMYRGRIVEIGRTAAVFAPPQHPYTRLLVQSVPQLRRDWLDDAIARRNPPFTSTVQRVARGCAFFGRCPAAIDGLCERSPPPPRNLGDGHVIHCHHDAASLPRTVH
jgi:peptide/nickel transport system ATP-binding protein